MTSPLAVIARTGPGRSLSTLRNSVINTLRTAGHRSIVAGLREVSYAPLTRPLDPLGVD